MRILTAKNRDLQTSLFMSTHNLKFLFGTPDSITRQLVLMKSRKDMTVVIPSTRIAHFGGLSDYLASDKSKLE